MIYGYWTPCGDYCVGCAVKRFGWLNRRAIVGMVKDNPHSLPINLWPTRIQWEEARQRLVEIKNKRSWVLAARVALNSGECRDECGDQIDPWSDYSTRPYQRCYCEDCDVDLGIEPTCIKDELGYFGMESCDCSECNTAVTV